MSGASGEPAEVFGSLALAAIEGGAFAGAVLRVEGSGGLLFEGAWGDAIRTGKERVPVQASTIFDLASVSKLFTATAILRLVTEGRLSLGEPVGCLYRRLFSKAGVGEAPLGRIEAALGDISVADLLSHSSGIHYWHPFYAEGGRSFEAILADLLEAHPPTREVVYSDLNFMILGRLVEGLAGAALPEAMRELVFGPLGLARTSYGKPLGPAAATEFGNRIERGMVAELGLSFAGWRDESRPIQGEPDDGNCHYFFHDAAGHAGVFSDAADLCRLGRLYLEGGRLGAPASYAGAAGGDAAEAYLAPGLAAEALRERRGGRGLGFQLGDLYPGGGAGHTGFSGTYLYLNAERGLSLSLLANRLHCAAPRNINPERRDFAAAALSLFR